MIRFLSIRHVAVIQAVDLHFEPGLTVLTGETGAGKSIVVGALSLLLGGRASPDLVRTGQQRARVQAIFEMPDGPETIVRREISAQGRSRAFIDDDMVTTTALRVLGARLVDLHGQHDQQMLLDSQTHLDLLDAYGGLQSARRDVAAAFARVRGLQTELDRLTVDEREKADRVETLRAQLAEIDRAAPRAGEDEELAATRHRLANADRLYRLCSEGHAALYERDRSILSELTTVWKRVDELAVLDARFVPYLEARAGMTSQLEDLAFALRDCAHDIDASPERLQQIEDRLAVLERLKKKYGGRLTDVLARRSELKSELEAAETGANRAGDLGRAVDAAAQAYLAGATLISRRRRELGPALTSRLEGLLAELAMERTRCELRFCGGSGEAPWTARGLDEAELFLSANPGEALRPLARIASGGELSRIMLALKTLGAPDAAGKTLVFDEVDAGIGARVASVVGRRLRDLGRRFQVVCVTHLPQIAAYAATHYRITKTVRQRRTITGAARLDDDGRVGEIARMMTGSEASDPGRQSARELLARASETDDKAKKTRNG